MRPGPGSVRRGRPNRIPALRRDCRRNMHGRVRPRQMWAEWTLPRRPNWLNRRALLLRLRCRARRLRPRFPSLRRRRQFSYRRFSSHPRSCPERPKPAPPKPPVKEKPRTAPPPAPQKPACIADAGKPSRSPGRAEESCSTRGSCATSRPAASFPAAHYHSRTANPSAAESAGKGTIEASSCACDSTRTAQD